MRNRFVPISELPQGEVYWHTALPQNIDLDRIHINVGRLATLQRLGGLASVDVVGYEGDITNYNYGVTGQNSDGTANATSAVSVRKAEMIGVEIDPSNDRRIYEWRRADASITLNTAELRERVHEADQLRGYSLDWHQAYAQELNQVIQKGLTLAVREHLIDNVDGWGKFRF